MALVLGEIAERNYKQQYGLLIADDLTDRYEPYLKQQNDSVQFDSNAIPNTNSVVGSLTERSALLFQKADSFSGIATIKKRESLLEIDSSSFSRSIVPIPSLTVRNCDVTENSSSKFEDILEEDEDENNVENVDTATIKTTKNVLAFSVPLVEVVDDSADRSRDQLTTTYDSVLPFKEKL